MTIKGHIRKRKNTKEMGKVVCLECQTMAINCKASCQKNDLYALYHSFRPPKRGSKAWLKISKLLHDYTVLDKDGIPVRTVNGWKYAPVFGSHGVGIQPTFGKRLTEQAYLDRVRELKGK